VKPLRQDLLLVVGLSLVAAACGDLNKKEDSAGSKQVASSSRPPRGAGKPKTRTANTPLAKAEDCYKPEDDSLCDMAKRIAALTNELRAGQGLPPLKLHAGWSFVATGWSQGQADVRAISHTGFPGDRDALYEKEFGTAEQPMLGAENVGRIDIHSDEVEEVSSTFGNGWWKSPGHHKNMVGEFSHIGVGIVKGGDGFYYSTQIFAWPSDEELEGGEEAAEAGDGEEASEAQVPVSA
jgi:uncharacterized protein YkwD